jgi:hypothetical protein
MDAALNVCALIVRGTLVWTDETQEAAVQWLCAGYVVVDGGNLTLAVTHKRAVLYIKANGATDPVLRTRALGGYNGAARACAGPHVVPTGGAGRAG